MDLNLDFSDPKVIIADILIVVILLGGLASGYKKGFLETVVKLVGDVLAIIGAYYLKNPISVFLYSNFPFFKFTGALEGVSVMNIVLYEVIAFVILLIGIELILGLVMKVTDLLDKLLSKIFIFGIPNKILGAIVGVVESFILLYFIICVLKIFGGIYGYELKPSLADNIIETPVLKDVFGPTFDAVNEIGTLAKNYESVNSRDEYNYEAMDILLKYDIITVENAKKLVDDKKIDIPEIEDLFEAYKGEIQ